MKKLFLALLLLLIPNIAFACSGSGSTVEVTIIVFILWLLQWLYFLYKFIISIIKKKKGNVKRGVSLLLNGLIGLFLYSVLTWMAGLLMACI